MRLQIGDKIRIVGILGFNHYGIYIGEWGGHPHSVVHNAKFKEVQIATLEAFADGRSVEIAERTARNDSEAARIVERALTLVGRKYDLVGFNCEHAANFALHGQAVSLAMQGAVMLGAILVLAAVARR